MDDDFSDRKASDVCIFSEQKLYQMIGNCPSTIRQITKLTIIHYETDFTQISNLIILPRNSNFQYFPHRFL